MPASAPPALIAVDLTVEAGDWPPEDALVPIAEAAIAVAFAAIEAEVAEPAEVSMVFTDDARVRGLNRDYRGVDAPTNVLSFPAEAQAPGRFGPLIGDIVFARETIAGEAAAGGLTVDDHLTHLMVHGFLHLFGYDHEVDEDATVMERLETAILARLGIADPYAEEDR